MTSNNNPEQTIIEITKKLDRAYEMEPGESLLELRQLLAKRFFIFDIFVPYRKLKNSDIKVSDTVTLKEVLYATN